MQGGSPLSSSKLSYNSGTKTLLGGDGGFEGGLTLEVDWDFTLVSNEFSSTITAGALSQDLQGFGTETTHGRGGNVYIVNSLADTNSGSQVAPSAYEGTLRYALLASGPRIIVFSISGTIELTSEITMKAANSNCAVFGQTAPGDGICIRMGSGTVGGSTRAPLLSFGGALANWDGAVHDILIQHIRFRHGAPNKEDSVQYKNIQFRRGAYNIVLDHCSLTWSDDENVNLWYGGQSNITFSRCIIGESVVRTREAGPNTSFEYGQNAGPLWGGQNSGAGEVCGDFSFHHCLLVHSWIRNPRYEVSGTVGTGLSMINNVFYNCFGQQVRLQQRSSQNSSYPVQFDAISNYFKAGADDQPAIPFTFAASEALPEPMRVYLLNNWKRNSDGSVHASANDEDNYATGMLVLQNAGATPTYTARTSPLASQPTNAISIGSPQDAYDSIVINSNVGATKPLLDSVDIRLINAPETNAAWSSSNVPGEFGVGDSAYPTLETAVYYGADVTKLVGDSSNNGLPDYYQSGVLGIDVTSTYNPAATYTLGNGYTDIENWIRTL
jgi:hypothetical protein